MPIVYGVARFVIAIVALVALTAGWAFASTVIHDGLLDVMSLVILAGLIGVGAYTVMGWPRYRRPPGLSD
jgi:hypothetical protein